jgi:5'-3' exoribonuclease 2
MHEPDSEIVDFYPSDIKLDINGHMFAWMGVNLIPFVESDRIRKAVKKYSHQFTTEDRKRNTLGNSLIYFNISEHFFNRIVGENYTTPGFSVYVSHPMYRTLAGSLKNDPYTNIKGKTFTLSNDEIKFENIDIENVYNCQIVSMIYEVPEKQPHRSLLLKGLTAPTKVVMQDQLEGNKRNFKGEQAIRLVQNTLGYSDEYDVDSNVRRDYFDRSYNNNRAIEYEPGDLDLMRRKRYQEGMISMEGEGNKRQKIDERQYQARQYEDKNYNNTNNSSRSDNRYNKGGERRYRDHTPRNEVGYAERRMDEKVAVIKEEIKSINKAASHSESLLTSFFSNSNVGGLSEDVDDNTRSNKKSDKNKKQEVKPENNNNNVINNLAALENIIKTYQNYTPNKK